MTELDRTDPDYGYCFTLKNNTKTNCDANKIELEDELDSLETGSD